MSTECRWCKTELEEPTTWTVAFCDSHCEQASKGAYDNYVDSMGKRYLRDEYD